MASVSRVNVLPRSMKGRELLLLLETFLHVCPMPRFSDSTCVRERP